MFSLAKAASGTLIESEIGSIAAQLGLGDSQIQRLLAQQQQYGLTLNSIHIGEVGIHMGDMFKNVGAGAVIINRPTLTNALNRLQADYSVEAAQALQQLADAVTRTQQPQAIDSLNALNEELEKPQPSKNRLRTCLDAIASSLPEMIDVAAAVAKVALLIL